MTYTVEIAFDARRGAFGKNKSRVERMIEFYGGVVSWEIADYAGRGSCFSHCQWVIGAEFFDEDISAVEALTKKVNRTQGIWIDSIVAGNFRLYGSRLYKKNTCQN